MQPLFYFPSTIVGIDDHRDSLVAIDTILASSNLINTFQNPQDALNFLNHYHAPLSLIPFLRPVTEGDEIGFPEHCPVDLNVLDIAKLADFNERQKEISVLIVDFNMPEINGLELCRKLKGTSMKKILLTGENNYKEALAAFNNQIIDNFIQKDSPSLVEELTQATKRLTVQYFSEKSLALLTHLEASHSLPLSDSAFINFFENWRKENKISEYYLIDKIGSFLCINNKGNKQHLILHTKSSLQDFSALYEKEITSQIPELFHDLCTYQKIPFFGVGRSPWEEEICSWEKYFHPSNTLEGKEKYFWTVI